MICWLEVQMHLVASGVKLQFGEDILCPVLPPRTFNPVQDHLSRSSSIVFIMFAALLHVLSKFLPSRLLALPKVSENIEISINSPKTMRMESDTGTPSILAAMHQGTDEPTADQGMISSTASSPSTMLVMAEAGTEIETPRSLTPESSVENQDSPSHVKISDLTALWTEQSEKVRREEVSVIQSSR